MTVTQRRILIAVLVFIGIVLLAIGVIYAAQPAGKLPHVLGRIKHAPYHRKKRELVALVGGVVLLFAAVAVGFAGRRGRQVQQLPPE